MCIILLQMKIYFQKTTSRSQYRSNSCTYTHKLDHLTQHKLRIEIGHMHSSQWEFLSYGPKFEEYGPCTRTWHELLPVSTIRKPTHPKLSDAPLSLVTVHTVWGCCKGEMTCLSLQNIPTASKLFSPIYFPRKATNSPSSQNVRSLVLQLSSGWRSDKSGWRAILCTAATYRRAFSVHP
jgi:hypothetical protein